MKEEFEFFVKTDLSRYEGEYVAIVGRKVVACGKDAKLVWNEAKKKFPSKTPMLAKIPREEALILVFE